MRIVFSSNCKLPQDRVRELLEFAARGVNTSQVEIHIKASSGGASGCAYSYVPGIANVAKTSRQLVTLTIPPTTESPNWSKKWWNSYGLKRIPMIYPVVPFESWEDVLIYLAAHEFRHIWQYDRDKRASRKGRKASGKGEHDASKRGIERLSEWRVATGRTPFVPVKQPNPFNRPVHRPIPAAFIENALRKSAEPARDNTPPQEVFDLVAGLIGHPADNDPRNRVAPRSGHGVRVLDL